MRRLHACSSCNTRRMPATDYWQKNLQQAGFEPANANIKDFKPFSLDQLGHCCILVNGIVVTYVAI